MLEQIGALAKQHWYIVVGAFGLLLVLGAVFRWKWVLESQGERSLGFLSWIRNVLGSGAYRFAIGAIGALILAFSITYPMLLG